MLSIAGNMKSIFLESDVILNCSHFEGESNAIIEAKCR